MRGNGLIPPPQVQHCDCCNGNRQRLDRLHGPTALAVLAQDLQRFPRLRRTQRPHPSREGGASGVLSASPVPPTPATATAAPEVVLPAPTAVTPTGGAGGGARSAGAQRRAQLGNHLLQLSDLFVQRRVNAPASPVQRCRWVRANATQERHYSGTPFHDRRRSRRDLVAGTSMLEHSRGTGSGDCSTGCLRQW